MQHTGQLTAAETERIVLEVLAKAKQQNAASVRITVGECTFEVHYHTQTVNELLR